MNQPFQSLPLSFFRKIFWSIFLVTIFLMVLMNLLNQPLMTVQAPQGIMSLELAGSQQNVESILASWEPFQQKIASFSLGLDFLFIPLYSTTLSLACLWTATILKAKKLAFGVIGIMLAWLQWGAAILDGMENFALINVMLENPDPSLAELASWCARLKFGIIFAGIIWCLIAMAAIMFKPGSGNDEI